mgnify:CR=1 FL=1
MKAVVGGLVLLLVASNAFWVFQMMDEGVTVFYRDKQIYELEKTQTQLMVMIPALTQGMKKKDILERVKPLVEEAPFDKEGCTWLGWTGLKFTHNNTLASVSPISSDGAKEDPCHPSQ